MPLSLSLFVLAAAGDPAFAARSRGAAPALPKTFRAEMVEPGRTQASELRELLGKPLRVMREGATHEYYFYDLGMGSTMDATVSVRKGVVEYVSYLCSDSMRDVRHKFGEEPSILRKLESGARGYVGSLSQVLYEGKGRGYVYEPRSLRVRACVAWEPGKKFEELGH